MQYLAVMFWIFLAGGQLSLAWQLRSFLPVLLGMQSGIVAFQLIRRRFATGNVPWRGQIIAWLSALLPMGLRLLSVSPVGLWLSMLGLLWALWSMLALGKSFGIAPADRGLVSSGPYRWVRHPMYAGELLSVLGGLIGNLTSWNGLVLVTLLASLLWRMREEERLLFGYKGYAASTPWRLYPGIW